MPAKAGIQKYLKTLDSRLRGNDAKGRFKTIYESVKAIKLKGGINRKTIKVLSSNMAYVNLTFLQLNLIFLGVLFGLCERLNGPS